MAYGAWALHTLPSHTNHPVYCMDWIRLVFKSTGRATPLTAVVSVVFLTYILIIIYYAVHFHARAALYMLLCVNIFELGYQRTSLFTAIKILLSTV